LSVAGIAGADDSQSKCIWIERLTVNADILLAAESIKESERQFVVSLTSMALGLSAQAQAGIELAKRHTEPDRWPLVLQLIAGAQSESGDVAGAFRTADLIDHAIVKQRTLKLIVARQAQRGDSANALKLLDRITDATERERALELIVTAHIDRGELDDATALAERVTDPQRLETLDRILEIKLKRDKLNTPLLTPLIPAADPSGSESGETGCALIVHANGPCRFTTADCIRSVPRLGRLRPWWDS
jgi:hypothetical protein